MIKFKPFELWLFWSTLFYFEVAMVLLATVNHKSIWFTVAQFAWIGLLCLPLLVTPLRKFFQEDNYASNGSEEQ